MKLNNYYIQDIENLKDFITVIFVVVDDIYNQHIPYAIKNRLHKNSAILSDSEIITISIVGELLSIDSERAWGFLCKQKFKRPFSYFLYLFVNLEEHLFIKHLKVIMQITEYVPLKKKLTMDIKSIQ